MLFLIKKSAIQGKGIFSIKEIKKGNLFYKIPTRDISVHPKRRCAKIGKVWVNDKQVLNFINHSCNPNSAITRKQNGVFIQSIKLIKKGDEIVVDYSKTEKGGTKIKCRCKSPNCRGYFLRVE